MIDLVSNPDWNTQRSGIDAIRALAQQIPEKLIDHRITILLALKPARFHKQKPVREIAQFTIKQLKEMEPPLEEHQLAMLDEGHDKKPQRISLRDQRSPKRPSTGQPNAGQQ